MGIFSNALTTLFDSSRERALSMLEDAQRAFNQFDLDSTVDSLLDRGSSLCDTLAEFGRTIKDSVADFKVVVPFNEKNEKFEYNVTGNILTVTVDGKNSHRETSATVPANCIVENLRCVVNKKKGEVVIIIPKDITKDENLKKIKEDTISKVKATAEQIVNTVKEKTDSIAENAEKAKTAKKKVGRDAQGRFTGTIKADAPKRTPKKKKNRKQTTAKEQA